MNNFESVIKEVFRKHCDGTLSDDIDNWNYGSMPVKPLINDLIALTGAELLADEPWFVIGSTNEYHGLKVDIDHVCSDTEGFIKEIRIADILSVFRKHGFEVIRFADVDNKTSKL